MFSLGWALCCTLYTNFLSSHSNPTNRYFSIYTCLLRRLFLRPTCRAGKRCALPAPGRPLQLGRGSGETGGNLSDGVSCFSVLWRVSGCSLTLLFVPELPKAVRHFAPRDLCVPITVHGSRLPFRRRSSWSKLRGGRKPRQSERRAIRARSGDRCSGSRTGDRRLPPNRAVSALPASRRSWGSAAEPAAQLTWGRGRESGAWPRVGGGPRGGVS